MKVTFIAKEMGFYKIVFSNRHSWMRAKTLRYRYVVLKPVSTEDLSDCITDEDLLEVAASRAMDVVPVALSEAFTEYRKVRGEL